MNVSLRGARKQWMLLRAAVSMIVALALGASITAPAFAAGGQFGNLTGTVVDATTHAPIANAAVTAASPSGTYHATTDGRGFFSILGMNVDTYSVSVQAVGYEPFSTAGVPIFGDETENMGSLPLAKHLKTITHVVSTAGSAFQPTQTIDSYSVSGARITEAQGKAFNTNENQLLTSIPGVTMTNAGIPTIRGGAAHEVGYQYDGVPFTDPFGGFNASNNLVAGIGDVQVVEGAGDATQGGVGAGVINVIPKRGTYPGFASVDLEMGAPNFRHQAGFEWGWATPNGRFSNYLAFTGQRYDPYYGYHNTNLLQYGNAYAVNDVINNVFTDNFIYRFGKNMRQSLQVLYTNFSNISQAPSLQNQYYNYSPFSFAAPYSIPEPAQYAGTPWPTLGQLGTLLPGEPATAQNGPSYQWLGNNQTELLKFEYDNSLSENTYLALRYYNWDTMQYSDSDLSFNPITFGGGGYQATGGPTVGGSLELTQQVGTNLTLDLQGEYNVQHPIWDGPQPPYTVYADFSPAEMAQFEDWTSPSQCQYMNTTFGGDPFGVPLNCSTATGGYIYNYFTSKGQPVPRIPWYGIGFNKSYFQNFGAGLRVQYSPSDKLKLDVGVRDEGQNEHYNSQLALYGQGAPAPLNPFDVPPSFWTSSFLTPRELQPRGSIVYQFDRNDSLRFGYGRSAVFSIAQDAGTPLHLYGIKPYLNVPAPAGATCGNSQFQGYPGDPAGYNYTFPCQSYGAAYYWGLDQVADAPDAGNTQPAIYNNYDLTYQHLFRNGYGMKLTGFNKVGTNLPSFYILTQLPTGFIFSTNNEGFNKTTGAEFDLSTPQRAVGLSGYLSATYQNVLSSVPPLTQSETFVPAVPRASLNMHELYRAGYVSPFNLNIGATWALKDGLSFTPNLTYNIGYPFSAGNYAAECLSDCPAGANEVDALLPTIDFGPTVNNAVTNGINGIYGSAVSTRYADPANPGTITAPNIDATRGINQGNFTGAYLSHPNLFANLTVQWKRGQNTFGVAIDNIFGNAWISTVPSVNPYYQPVATGVSGPQTNYNDCALLGYAPGQFGCSSTIPTEAYAYKNGAYLLTNGNFTSGAALGPQVPTNFLFFYQRSI